MDPYRLLKDPNFVSALHKLHFKVIVDRLARWENISVTDLYANADMNTEMERLFGIPVYEEHKEMLRKAATQRRFYCSTVEEVITTMKKEEAAEAARSNNLTNLKSFNSLNLKSTNESVSFEASTSSIKKTCGAQATSNKVSPHRPIPNPSLPMSLYDTYGLYPPEVHRNDVFRVHFSDIPTPHTVEAPSYINQSPRPLHVNGTLNYLNNAPAQKIKPRIEPINQTYSGFHRSSSMLVNNEQASVSFYPVASIEPSPAPALYSGVVKKRRPVSTKVNE